MLFDFDPLIGAFGSLSLGAGITMSLGVFIGVLSSFLGVGGGFISTPYLHSVLHLSAAGAVATSMGQIPLMSFSSSIQYYRNNKIRMIEGGWLLVGSLPAAQGIAILIGNLGDSPLGRDPVWPGMSAADLVLMLNYGFLIGLMGLYNLYRSFRTQKQKNEANSGPLLRIGWRRNCATILAGIIVGTLSVMLGIGGGFLSVPFFVYLCDFEPVEAVATSLFTMFVTSVFTTLHYILTDQIYLGIALTGAAGSMVGAYFGSRFAIRVKQAYILRTFGFVQIAVVFAYIISKVY